MNADTGDRAGSPALEVVVLGCSGSYATVDNACTGYLVRSREAAVLLDCGPGTLGPLQGEIALTELSGVVTTHCHPDHWLELPVLRNVFTWFECRTGVPVYGTAETRAMDAAVRSRSERPDPLEWHTVDADAVVEIGDQRFTFSRTDHPVETLAVRVEAGGRTFAFSADTGPGWDFRGLGSGIDLAFSDATHTRRHENQGIPHLSARQAAVAARRAGVGRLVLTHLMPGSDPAEHGAEAAEVWGDEVAVARPGARFVV